MPRVFVLIYSMFAIALLIALTAIPLAARRAGQSAWWKHAAASTGAALALATVAWWQVYQGAVPWAQCAAAYLVNTALPALFTGWGARVAVGARPHTPRTSAAVGALVTLVLTVWAASFAAAPLMPDLIIAASP